MNPMEQVNLIGKLADLKSQQYDTLLLLSALTDLLIEKGLLTQAELQARIVSLDADALPERFHG
ncbi:hypothetical protein N6H14_10220 [Paenibacillus sp. CC-CFT747]|nr:hypothetical protein N6H14_10220 [Paenibacillus sp. CC-CFT747]